MLNSFLKSLQIYQQLFLSSILRTIYCVSTMHQMINHYFHSGLFPQIKSSVHFCDGGNLLVLSGQNMEEVRGKYIYIYTLCNNNNRFSFILQILLITYYSLLVDKTSYVNSRSLQWEKKLGMKILVKFCKAQKKKI